jgi:platelet-activating factor acetylhydrolase
VDLSGKLPSLELQDYQRVDSDRTGGGSFPVLIFSHGFASSRTDYTHYLGELASRGYIVAAIEHRDGSGPGSIVMKQGSRDRVVFPLRQSDLEDHPDLDTASFKKVQLDFRQAEVEETVRVLRQLNEGDGGFAYKFNPRQEGQDLKNWAGRLAMDEVTIGGHSFGATLAVSPPAPASRPSASIAI